MTRESSHYPPERTKQFLMEAKLPDARCAPALCSCTSQCLVPEHARLLHCHAPMAVARARVPGALHGACSSCVRCKLFGSQLGLRDAFDSAA